MQKKQIIRILTIVIFGVAMLVPCAQADIFIKQVMHQDAVEVMGQKQAAADDTMTIWLKTGMACVNMPEGQTFISDLEKDICYVVDHNRKAYAELPLDVDKRMEILAGEEGAEMVAMMKQMMSSITVEVTPTEQTKTIGEWKTKKYLVNTKLPMGSVMSEIWVDDSKKGNMEVYNKTKSLLFMSFPGYDKILEEMEKIEGLPILSDDTIEMMGTKIKGYTRILEYEEKEAPAGTYELPKDFTKKKVSEILGQ